MSDRSGTRLAIFFALAYAITWTCFIAVAIAVPYRTVAGQLLVLLGAYSPAFAALFVTWRWGGPAEVSRLLSGIGRWRVGAGWFVLAATYTVALRLTAAVLHRVAFGAWPRFETAGLALVPFAIAVSWPFQLGEELGWRGFALPRMADRLGFPLASLALGVAWACWHLPQFYIAGADTYHQSFVAYFTGVVAMSVLFAWAYERTRGSLPIVTLMHAAYNNSKDIVPSAAVPPPGVFSLAASRVTWLFVGLLWACALLCLWDMQRRQRRERLLAAIPRSSASTWAP